MYNHTAKEEGAIEKQKTHLKGEGMRDKGGRDNDCGYPQRARAGMGLSKDSLEPVS